MLIDSFLFLILFSFNFREVILRKQLTGYSPIPMLLLHLTWKPHHRTRLLVQPMQGYRMGEEVSDLKNLFDFLFFTFSIIIVSRMKLTLIRNSPSDEKYLFGLFASTEYRLMGIVSHIGTSTQCGHYVAHILKDGRWTIFNDNKVGASIHPPKDMGYLYFFERLSS